METPSLHLHRNSKGKLEIRSKVPLNSRSDLSLAYSPGVADACNAIVSDPSAVYTYTTKQNTVAVISDGSAVLGLGNIGPLAAMPVMEGKAILFKHFGDVDAFPICLNTQDVEEIIKTIEMIAPTFGGINLEDISAPRCFEIEERLKHSLNIPVFHDDQHGTAIVVLAGLINSLKITNREISKTKIVLNGIGAAGNAIAKLLYKFGARNVSLVDRSGIISVENEKIDEHKRKLVEMFEIKSQHGTLKDALVGTDIFIGVSAPNLLTADDIQTMAKDPIVFALANPIPEIMPDEALKGGAMIVATGRSDFPNQINNLLAFPGIFKGLFKHKIKFITEEMKMNAAIAIAEHLKNPSKDNIVPDTMDPEIPEIVASSLLKQIKLTKN